MADWTNLREDEVITLEMADPYANDPRFKQMRVLTGEYARLADTYRANPTDANKQAADAAHEKCKAYGNEHRSCGLHWLIPDRGFLPTVRVQPVADETPADSDSDDGECWFSRNHR